MCVCTAPSGALQPYGEMKKGEMCTKIVRGRQGKKVLDKFISLFLCGCFLFCGVRAFFVVCLWGGFIVFWFVWWSLPPQNESSLYLLHADTN